MYIYKSRWAAGGYPLAQGPGLRTIDDILIGERQTQHTSEERQKRQSKQYR